MHADAVVPEVVWSLEVNGRLHAAGTAAPGDFEALALGRLVADGFLAPDERPEALTVDAAPAGTTRLRARVDATRALAAFGEAEHRLEHGCGLRHFVDCAPIRSPGARRLPVPSPDVLASALRDLFDATRGARGIHTIGLWDGERLVHVVQEVARHAGVDKACGWIVSAGREPGRLGLVLTARISGEIAAKAARTGVAWIASRSVPTSLAAEIARAAELPIVARAGAGLPRPGVAETGA